MKKVASWIMTTICTIVLLAFSISVFAIARSDINLDNNPVVVGIGVAMAYLGYLALHKFFGGDKDEKQNRS